MSSVHSLSAVRDAKARASQKSHAKGFGRARMVVVPVIDKPGFMAWWAGVMRRRCGADAVQISRMFSVTEQTGRNWLAEHSCPLAYHMDLACELWPEEFEARYGVALRVAA